MAKSDLKWFEQETRGGPIYNQYFNPHNDNATDRYRRDKPFSLKYPLSVGTPSLPAAGLNYNSNLSSEFAKTRASEGIDKEAVEPFVFFEFMEVIPKAKDIKNKKNQEYHQQFVKKKKIISTQQNDQNTSLASAIMEKVEYAMIGGVNAESNQHVDPPKSGDALGGAIGQAKEEGLLKPALRQYKGSIAMYMPTDISVNDSIQYNEQSRKTFGIMQGLMEGDVHTESALAAVAPAAIIGTGMALGGFSKFLGGKIGSTMMAEKGGVAGTFLGAAGVGIIMDEYQRSTGKASNPHDYMAYQSTGMRSFTYTFTFLPDSEKESLEVTNIIRQFRHGAHAERFDALKLTVPEHVIVSHHGAGDMIQMPPLVIESVNVSYNPNNSSFFMEGGNPVEVGLAITLKEIVPIYKHDIEGGM